MTARRRAERLREVLAEPGQYFLPTVHRRVLPVVGAVDGEEGMASVVVGVELVGLVVLREGGLGLRGVVGRWARVLHAEEAQERTLEILGEVDGRHGLARRELLSLGDHTAAVAVDGGIDSAQRAGGEIGLAAPRAVADDAYLAIQIRKGTEVADGALHVPHGAVIGHAARGTDARAVLLRRGLALAELQVGREGGEAMMGEAAGNFLGGSVPAGHVVDDDDARQQSATQRSGDRRRSDRPDVHGASLSQRSG